MHKPVPQFNIDQSWGYFSPRGWRSLLIHLCRRLNPRLPFSYRLSLWLRSPIKHGTPHPLDVLVWGLRLRLLPRGNISETKMLFTPDIFDPEELAWLASYLGPDAVFVDVGANAGAYSWFMRSQFGKNIRIIAVEPDPEMRRRLAFNLLTNDIRNIEVCPVALSDTQGEAVLQLCEDQRGQNALVDQASAMGQTITVPVDTLANLFAARAVDRIDALKIDIEGHEVRALGHFFSHAPASLWPRALVTEFKPETSADILRIMEGAGYRRAKITKLNWLFERAAA